MQLTMVEQVRERQEMEKKLQKLAKTMDHLERAKREEAAPLIDAAYQQRLVEERILHEREQQVCLLVFPWKQFKFYTFFLSSCNTIFFLLHSI